MNSETGEGLSKYCGGLGFPFRGLRGERKEEGVTVRRDAM